MIVYETAIPRRLPRGAALGGHPGLMNLRDIPSKSFPQVIENKMLETGYRNRDYYRSAFDKYGVEARDS